ncbi:MAG: serine/threonine protein phosphatase [Flavobacteriaceae bacterium]|nr:serine/threonine protein phosphatase [Flavobacteriaceae bacterium]
MRSLVVGDIHGGLKGLQQGLERAEPQAEDQFVFLGDYVDGWSEAAETVSFLIDFAEKFDCIFIRGNHDWLTHRFLKQGEDNPMWDMHGGTATKLSYRDLASDELQKHLLFYENLKNFHIDDHNRLFIHAGFTNLHGPQHEYFRNLVFWDRTLWETARCLDPDLDLEHPNYPARLKLFHEIYIGHTPVTRLGSTSPLNFANVWNIDTGAAFRGPVTLLDVDSKEYWQSDPVYLFYPDEEGRN